MRISVPVQSTWWEGGYSGTQTPRRPPPALRPPPHRERNLARRFPALQERTHDSSKPFPEGPSPRGEGRGTGGGPEGGRLFYSTLYVTPSDRPRSSVTTSRCSPRTGDQEAARRGRGLGGGDQQAVLVPVEMPHPGRGLGDEGDALVLGRRVPPQAVGGRAVRRDDARRLAVRDPLAARPRGGAASCDRDPLRPPPGHQLRRVEREQPELVRPAGHAVAGQQLARSRGRPAPAGGACRRSSFERPGR